MSLSNERKGELRGKSCAANSIEVRVATELAGKRRMVVDAARKVASKVIIGAAADLLSLAGVPLEEGPVKRAQERLNARSRRGI